VAANIAPRPRSLRDVVVSIVNCLLTPVTAAFDAADDLRQQIGCRVKRPLLALVNWLDAEHSYRTRPDSANNRATKATPMS